MAARKKKTETEAPPKRVIPDHTNLAELLSVKPIFKTATFWIVGDTPLITHAWSHKAKMAMLQKQVKATTPGREKRDPQADFVSSLYEMRDGVFGFPVTGVKNCLLAAAHKDKGIARSAVMASLFLEAEMVRVMPALAGAICDLGLVRIWAGEPEMREDMVKIGSGLNKVASLAYRAQFTHWAIKIEARFNPEVLTPEALAFIVQESGLAFGLGEWRNEKKGIFGAFHLAGIKEAREWDNFAQGSGTLPIAENFKQAAE